MHPSIRGEDFCFIFLPIRNKNCLWWPCLLMNRDEMSNLIGGLFVYASYKRFQRKKIKCEKITERRRTPSYAWTAWITPRIWRFATCGVKYLCTELRHNCIIWSPNSEQSLSIILRKKFATKRLIFTQNVVECIPSSSITICISFVPSPIVRHSASGIPKIYKWTVTLSSLFSIPSILEMSLCRFLSTGADNLSLCWR